MQHSSKKEKIVSKRQIGWNEETTRKGDKRNKRQRGNTDKRNWQE